MTTAIFELATLKDEAELLPMIEAFYAIDGYDFDKNKMANAVCAFLENQTLGAVWLIKVEKETAGYICLTMGYSFEYGGKIAVLDELYIKENFRNNGLGKESLAFVDAHAIANNIKAVHMEVEEHNARAMGLYTSRGYSSKGRRLYSKYYE